MAHQKKVFEEDPVPVVSCQAVAGEARSAEACEYAAAGTDHAGKDLAENRVRKIEDQCETEFDRSEIEMARFGKEADRSGIEADHFEIEGDHPGTVGVRSEMEEAHFETEVKSLALQADLETAEVEQMANCACQVARSLAAAEGMAIVEAEQRVRVVAETEVPAGHTVADMMSRLNYLEVLRIGLGVEGIPESPPVQQIISKTQINWQ